MSVDYAQIAKDARKKVLELIFKAGTSHIGSCLSAIDIMAVLFEKADLEKDEVILSAGWKAAAWYYFLWRKGIITEEELNSFCQLNSPFIGLVEPMGRWGLKVGSGSMGMGLPFAVGFALAKKLKGEEGKVYVLISDGEIQCGQTWESALIAAHHKLDNLIVIIDYNQFQAMGKINDILSIEPLKEKWRTFGWADMEVDGHNFEEIKKYIDVASFFNYVDFYKHSPSSRMTRTLREALYAPKVIIAKTIKGKGVSFMENSNLYHYKNLSQEEYQLALKELK